MHCSCAVCFRAHYYEVAKCQHLLYDQFFLCTFTGRVLLLKTCMQQIGQKMFTLPVFLCILDEMVKLNSGLL